MRTGVAVHLRPTDGTDVWGARSTAAEFRAIVIAIRSSVASRRLRVRSLPAKPSTPSSTITPPTNPPKCPVAGPSSALNLSLHPEVRQPAQRRRRLFADSLQAPSLRDVVKLRAAINRFHAEHNHCLSPSTGPPIRQDHCGRYPRAPRVGFNPLASCYWTAVRRLALV